MAYVYTVEEFDAIKSKYLAGVAIESLAEQYDKPVASIRMKLVKAGLYQKAEKPKAAASAAIATTTVASTAYVVPKASSSTGRMSKVAFKEHCIKMRDMLIEAGPAPF